MIHILHLEDSKRDAELIYDLIVSSKIPHNYFLVENSEEYLRILNTNKIDLVLSDYSLPDYSGQEALEVVRSRFSKLPFIYVSGEMGEDKAIEALVNGATDYVLKHKLERLIPAINRATHEYDLEKKRLQFEELLKTKSEMIAAQNEKYKLMNKELIFQNQEKNRRADELIIANIELAFQNKEKEKRAAELVIANIELINQNIEKEKRAAELLIANHELFFRNEDIALKATELIRANIKKEEVAKTRLIIEAKNKNITDSIYYAKRIQMAKLPKKEIIYENLCQSFILFKPKDIVSGDFYFFHKTEGSLFLVAADCTGHGVPGAFMSMIGTDKLVEAFSQSTNTSEILKFLNKGIKSALNQSDSRESTRDGMDIAICSINNENRSVNYAGANRPIWVIRKNSTEVEEIKATKKAIGGFTHDDQEFETHTLQFNEGDTFYIFTDGYADQFGGSNNKKLMTKKFKEILVFIQSLSLMEQENYLDQYIEKWKANNEQVDDILVIGVRL